MGLFPDDFLHLGGDEVNTDCWTKTPSISSRLSAHNLTADGGYAHFVGRAASIAIAQGRRPVQWSEVYDHFKDTLPKETVVHVWKDVTNVTEVLAGGYDVLRNVGYDKTSWYLDNLDVAWKQVYANEPCHDVPDALCPKILGGHGEMWGETVDTSDIEQTIWPKLAAIAEKLWSPRAATVDADAAYPRMVNFRCVLNERGIAAPPAGECRRAQRAAAAAAAARASARPLGSSCAVREGDSRILSRSLLRDYVCHPSCVIASLTTHLRRASACAVAAPGPCAPGLLYVLSALSEHVERRERRAARALRR